MILKFALAIFLALAPFSAYAKTVAPPLEISGWIPYWRTATGTADALAHIDSFKEINPSAYRLKTDGTFLDARKIGEDR